MDLIRYIGLRVKIVLNNSAQYYYVGQVIDADENSLDLIDLKNQMVSINKTSILTIQEISNG